MLRPIKLFDAECTVLRNVIEILTIGKVTVVVSITCDIFQTVCIGSSGTAVSVYFHVVIKFHVSLGPRLFVTL